jgi:hypothetical protein
MSVHTSSSFFWQALILFLFETSHNSTRNLLDYFILESINNVYNDRKNRILTNSYFFTFSFFIHRFFVCRSYIILSFHQSQGGGHLTYSNKRSQFVYVFIWLTEYYSFLIVVGKREERERERERETQKKKTFTTESSQEF